MKRLMDEKTGRMIVIVKRAGFLEARYAGQKTRVFGRRDHRELVNNLRFLSGMKARAQR